MRRPVSCVIISLSLCATASAVPIPLFNTGQPFAPGASDTNWTLTSAASGGTLPRSATVMTPNGAWLANNATSKWIGPVADGATNVAPGTYTYVTTFDLTGFDPTSATITLRISSDNNVGSVLLNGNNTGITQTGFTAFGANQTINNPTFYLAGVNTLTFNVNNTLSFSSPTGLRVEFISSNVEPIPEPATAAALAIAVLVGWGVCRRQRAA